MVKPILILSLVFCSVIAISIASNSASLNFLTKPLADSLYDTAGWIEYSSKDYNTTNRLTVGTALQNFSMVNYTVKDQELPVGITNTTWFNGTHIRTENAGNSFLYRFRYEAEPSANGALCEFFWYLNGTVGQLPLRALTFPKGVGVETIGSFTNVEYTLDTWLANGAMIQMSCSVDVDFWDIEMTIERLYVGKGTY